MLPTLRGIARVVLKIYPSADALRQTTFGDLSTQPRYEPCPSRHSERPIDPAPGVSARVSLMTLDDDLFRQKFQIRSAYMGEDGRGTFVRFLFRKEYNPKRLLSRYEQEIALILEAALYEQTWMTRVQVTQTDRTQVVRIRGINPQPVEIRKPLTA